MNNSDVIFSFPVEVDINGIREVWVNVRDYVPYRGANMSGHPDTWSPPEGGELDYFFSWHDNEEMSDILESSINDEDWNRIEQEVWKEIELRNSQEY